MRRTANQALCSIVWMLMVLLAAGLTACSGGAATRTEAPAQVGAGVEVLYFYGKQRCATCVAIERGAQTAVETLFADALKDGRLAYRAIDVSTPEGEAVADRYEVSWSSLVLVKHGEDGGETAENLTKFAFATARSHPEDFRSGLAEKITRLLE